MKARFFISALLNSIILSFVANCFPLMQQHPQSLFVIIPVFVAINFLGGILIPHVSNRKTAVCQHGTILLCSFYVCVIVSIIYHILFIINHYADNRSTFWWSVLICFAANFIVFWNGIICVYLTSTQLGLKWRIIGAVCGLIPIVNLIVLFFILKTTTGECLFESRKSRINKRRKSQQLCATKYPILLVHGVFFRDYKYFNYWGRIPDELKTNGANIFYGNHSSAASIADSAAELKTRIAQILKETGAEKVNIIAHSKGGLDCRYAISKLDIGNCVASLTTINTPHRGCLFADYLLTKISENIQSKIANTYNSALKKLGEENPDFLAAVNDLTAAHCSALDAEMQTPDGVYCQSVGSVMGKASGGAFPLNFSYHLVKHFSGENDGLVSEDSFRWGENYTLLKPCSDQGISHGDIIDLNRKNLCDFDVREFYVNLVNDLKNKGL